MNDFGATFLLVGVILFILATFFVTEEVKCNDRAQHCIHYGPGTSETFEAPKGMPNQVDQP